MNNTYWALRVHPCHMVQLNAPTHQTFVRNNDIYWHARIGALGCITLQGQADFPSMYKVLTMVHLPSAPQHPAQSLLHHVSYGSSGE